MLLIAELLMYFLLLLSLLYCWFRWSHRDLLRTAAGLPETHKTWPIFGHSFAAFGGRESITRKLLEISMVAVAKGLKTCCFWCGPLPLIMVHDIEDIKTVLNSSNTSSKSDEYEYFMFGFDTDAGPLTNNMLTSAGNTWRQRRKHMSPVFHPRNLEHMIPAFNHNSRELLSCLSRHVDQGPVNLLPYSMDTALKTVCRACLSRHVDQGPVNFLPYTMDTALKTVCNMVFGPGVVIDITSPEFCGLATFVESVPELFIARLLRPWLRIDVVFHFLYRHELKKLNQYCNSFTTSRLEVAKMISKQKNLESATRNVQQDRVMSEERVQEPLNIMDAFRTLQTSHPEYTEAYLNTEILGLFTTGTDSVGSAAASCFLALAQYQEMQERSYQEVCSVVGPDDDVTLEDLNRMPYLDRVIKETLRWFLIVPYVMRKATKDVKLSTCIIPAGHSLMVALMAVHMDPKIYSDPLKFDPDRFSDKNPAGKERITYMPFSGGPRNCIAKTYAMQLMKIMLVHVLRRFRLRTDMNIHKLRRVFVVTLISAEGYNVYLERREQLTQ